ncbi:MAG: DUF308 domain-containing protein [Lachnospiraceae bacterium]|nr:DUF308 domain-containing protein [Lachnospiraceae bacterium]
MSVLKILKWDSIITSVLYIITGIAIILMPETAQEVFAYIIAAVLMISGAISIIAYFVRNAVENYNRNDFFNGIIMIAFGVVMLLQIEAIIDIVNIIFGMMIVIAGCMLMQDAIDMKRLKYGNFALFLVLAIIIIAFGFLLVKNPFKSAQLLMNLLGGSIVVSGVLTLFTTLYLSHATRKAIEAIEASEALEKEEADEEA